MRAALGRKPECDITLDDIRVSGEHAEIIFDKGRRILRDLGSSNGTFVNNEPITEKVLAEGDTIKVGDTELAFLKTGKAAANGDNAPLDEVRVIHDVRPMRRGAGGLILLLVLFLALGGAGYYYFFYMDSEKTFVPLEAEKGNLLASGWSFEGSSDKSGDSADAWDLRSDTLSMASLTKKGARSGMYAAKLSIPDGGFARAVFAKPIAVNPRRQYTASAYVQITGNTMAALKAVFHGIDPTSGNRIALYTDEFASGREQGLDYFRIEGTVFPPPEATEMEFVLLAAGKGEVIIDDVSLFEGSSGSPAQLGSSGVMDFFSCGGGFLVRRIGQTLFLGGRLEAVMTPQEEETVYYDTDLSGFSLEGEGYLFCGPQAGLVRSKRTLNVNAQEIEGTFAMPAVGQGVLHDLRYCFDLYTPYADDGVGILAGGEFTLYGSDFPAVAADALIFGGDRDRVKVSFQRPASVAGTSRKDGGVSLQCLLDPSQEISFTFQIQSDFTEDVRQAQALVQQAARAQKEERYGEGLSLVEQVGKRYPYNDSVVDRSEEIRGEILGVKRLWLGDIQERLRSAQFLNTPEQFKALEQTCERALTHFPGDKDFTGALDEVREKGSVLRLAIRDRRAERYYRIASNLFEAGSRPASLALIQRYLEKRFPGSEWTEKALRLGTEEATE